MKTEADLLPLPEKFRESRDCLRVDGYALVRYTSAHARSEAARYRHPPAASEYAIHKIEFIDPEERQILINESAFCSSEQRVPDWTRYYTEKERLATAGAAANATRS